MSKVLVSLTLCPKVMHQLPAKQKKYSKKGEKILWKLLRAFFRAILSFTPIYFRNQKQTPLSENVIDMCVCVFVDT